MQAPEPARLSPIEAWQGRVAENKIMKNTIGNNITVTIFGESHGQAVGAVIDGLAPGIEVDQDTIAHYLARRRPNGATDTARCESDDFRILSGVFNGYTCGTPITIVIPNQDKHSSDYIYGIARPSHADLTAYYKYHGYEDYRGGGHFSGRVTAAIVAAGGILLPALAKEGIHIGTHIAYCGGINDRDFSKEKLRDDIVSLSQMMFPVLDEDKGAQMREKIINAGEECDSIGGITETVISGMPTGVGEPWFDSVESMISHAIFSIGAIKGIEFGAGFAFADMKGSEANDPIGIKDGIFYTKTNNNGGINGGITNGMPVTFKCAVKPTPSIFKSQQTVDFVKKEETEHMIKGRHDPAVIRRICPVIDSMCAIVVCDMLAGRFGTDLQGKLGRDE